MGATHVMKAAVQTDFESPYYDAAIETMPREALATLQFERLRSMLRNAYDHVPLHRQRMEEAGVVPEEVRTPADLHRVPFTFKTDLRDHYPFGMFARSTADLVRLHASSGTTGKSTLVGYTQSDIDNWASLMARSLYGAGARSRDVIHNAYGYGLFTGGLGAHYGGERLGAAVVPVSGGATERQIGLIMDLKPRVLCATPSYALAMVEVAEQMGVDLRESALEVGVFGAEPWSNAMRSEIQERMGLKAIDIYGLSEIMGPGVACECSAQAGLHGWEDHFLFEVLDPETQMPVPEGHAGELVITTLTKQALPMLRYRTRDITRVTTDRCDCGRTHMRILRITGRSDDMLIIRGVNVYPSQVEAVLVGRPMLTAHYQLVVERKGMLDEVTIEVEALPGVDVQAYASIAKDVAHHVKSMVGISTQVQVKEPGTIPRSQGKAVRVRDLRPKD